MFTSTLLREGLRVLVVDSHTDSSDFLITLFAEYGIETRVANCISESLELMQQDCPDLLISEIVLPDGDGYSLIQQVKNFELVHGVQIPAVALTTCAKESDRIRALTAGFCSHLPKPLDVDELIATVLRLTVQNEEAVLNASS